MRKKAIDFGVTMVNGNLVYNTTPHAIKLFVDDGKEIIIPAAKFPMRLREKREKIDEIAPGIKINRVQYFLDELDISHPEKGVYYIVSAVVASRISREDFLIVDETVRDEEGKIIGCRAFAKI